MNVKVLATFLIYAISFGLCEANRFFRPSMRTTCAYHIHNGNPVNFATAKAECENLNASLAIIKNLTQQNVIDSLAEILMRNERGEKEVPDGRKQSVWVEGERQNGVWKWLDNTAISIVANISYPKWGNGKPDRSRKSYLMLTRDPSIARGNFGLMHWTNQGKRYNSSYVCERLASGFPCDSSPCDNGECVNVGCSYRCDSHAGFAGRHCDNQIQCERPDSPHHDRVNVSPGKQRFSIGETVSFSCDSGYRIDGSDTSTCRSNGGVGEWTQRTSCIQIQCERPDSPHNGNISLSSVKQRFSIGETVSFSCDSGYRIDGAKIATCTGQGQWTPQPSCTSVSCANRRAPSHGRINGQSSIKLARGDAITFVCDNSFALSGKNTSTCQPDGSWDHEVPRCEPIFQRRRSTCTYHFSNEGASYVDAKQTCEGFNASLVMVNDDSKQREIYDVIQAKVGTASDVTIWIGAELQNECTWLDQTKIPRSKNDRGYPGWLGGYPTAVDQGNYSVVISKRAAKQFYWTLQAQRSQNKYICERSNGNVCQHSPCANAGVCLVVGCSYTCRCEKLYYGRHCENMRLAHVKQHPTSDIFNNTFKLLCKFRGWPLPDVKWFIKYTSRNNEYTEINSSYGSLFRVGNATNGNEIESKLTMDAGAMCLGRSKMKCTANNNDDTRSHTFNVNSARYKAKLSSYFSFNTTRVRHDEAERHCRGLGGELVSILDENIQNYLIKTLKKIESRILNGVWIGLRRVENGSLAWPDQILMSYQNFANNQPRSLYNCTYIFKNNWKWRSDNCNYNRGFICQIPVRQIPTVTSVLPPPCASTDNTTLIVRWRSSPTMRDIVHSVNVLSKKSSTFFKTELVIPTQVVDESGLIKTTFRSLKPNTNYKIKVTVAPAQCGIELSARGHGRTGYPLPSRVDNAILRQVNNTACRVAWDASEQSGISHFNVIVDEYTHWFTRRNGASREKKNSFARIATSKSRYLLFSIPSPNRVYAVRVFGESCTENGSSVNASGKCISSPSAPSSVIPPRLENDHLILKAIDEENGPISCYFVIGQYHDTEVKVQPKRPSKEFLNSTLMSPNKTSPAKEYLVFAIQGSSFANELQFVVGDDSTTKCDINDMSFIEKPSRKRRSAADRSVFSATNHRIVSGKYYSFYTITTTPLHENDVAFAASDVITKKIEVKSEDSPTSKEGPAIPGWAIGVGVVLVIAIVLSVLFTVKRRRSSFAVMRTPSKNPRGNTCTYYNQSIALDMVEYANIQHNESHPESTAIRLLDLKEVYLSLIQPDNSLLKEQFSAISIQSALVDMTKEVGHLQRNKKRNRYKNIVPYDNTRVKLTSRNTGESDYINASYIDSYDQPNFFIATQGPLDRTVAHFWSMIWQQRCRVIVMLTKCLENGKMKCAKYWPDVNQSIKVGDITVVANETVENGSYVVRKFVLNTSNGENMTVSQFQFTEWPDHGVPVTTSDIFRLHTAMLREHNEARGVPIVVHCSAGAGCTGTLIAIDALMREMAGGQSIDVYSAVMNMRKQRCDMVQTQNQYEFLHKVLVEHYLFGDTNFDVGELDAKLAQLAILSSHEFINLEIIPPLITSQKFGGKAIYRAMHRQHATVPYDHSRVVLSFGIHNHVTPYVNASYVKEYVSSGKMITTQGPMSNTVNEFWKTVLDCGVKIIVMLTPLQEGNREMCYRYWPDAVGSTETFGPITVTLADIKENRTYTSRTMDVANKNSTIRVTQFHYRNWLEHCTPPDGEELVILLNDVTSLRNRTSDCSIVVHCSDGLGRTGVFCALSNLVERLKAEQRIDVFRTVKDLRDMRPRMVPSLEMYELCYRLLKTYLYSFNPYCNFSG